MADDSDQNQQPTFWHGLMAGLQSGLNQAPSNPLVNLGLGLMSAAKPGGNVGDALMQANQQTMQNRGLMQQQQLFQAKLPGLQRYYNRLAQMPNMSAPGSSSSSVPSMSMDPQAAVDTGTLGAAMGIEGASALTKYPENISAAQKALQQQKQMQVQGPMGVLDTVSTAPNAHILVQNIPGMMDQWTKTAPQLGLDPTKDLSADNARAFAIKSYNDLAGSAGLPPKPMPQPMQDVPATPGKTPPGQVVQENPVTHKKEVAVPPQPLTAIAGPSGAPILAPQGQAAGKSPFNEQIYATNQISPSTLEQNYQQWKATGKPPANASRNVLANATQANYIAQRAQQDNIANPGQKAAAQAQAYEAQQAVIKDFTDPSGKAGGQLQAINTAVAHINGLTPLIDAMQSGNMTLINKARQEYQKASGIAAPTNYQALANMAIGEVAKAVNAGGGSEAERDSIAAPFKASGGPDVLKGAVQTVSTALAGKTEALRNAWDVGTQGTQGPFDKFLMPQTKRALGIADSAHPANIQALIDKYARKANGGS